MLLLIVGAVAGLMVGAWLAERSGRPSGSVASNGGGAQQASVALVPATPSASGGPMGTPVSMTPSRTAITTLEPTPTLIARPRATPLVHVVKRGETLSSIARRYDIPIAALKRANVIKDPNLITVGQKLIVPRR